MVLNAGTDAAPEGFVGFGKCLEGSRPQRHIVGHHSAGRILRSKNVVVETALVKVHDFSRRCPGEEVARQLEHVVCVARLRTRLAEMLREILGWKKRLTVAVSSDDIRAVARHPLPEEACDIVIALLSGHLVLAGGSNCLWYLSVRMQPIERILSTCERIKQS